MDGATLGLFGSEPEVRSAFAAAVAKKAEAEGIAVYHRTEGGRKASFLDAPDNPERIQRCASIASMVDHAFFFFPRSHRLAAPDGELAVLLGSLGLPGTLEIIDGSATPDGAKTALKGTAVAGYSVHETFSGSSSVDLSIVKPRAGWPRSRSERCTCSFRGSWSRQSLKAPERG